MIQLAGNVPGNRLALAVRVRRQEHLGRLFGLRPQFLQHLLLTLNGDVLRCEITCAVSMPKRRLGKSFTWPTEAFTV